MIDFTFTEEQEMFRKSSREFAENRLAPFVPEMEKTGKMPPGLIKAMAEAEMMAITIPEEYGGLGLGYVARLIALEEISRISVAAGMTLQVFGLGIDPIVRFGTEAQKKKYLPLLAAGERLAGVAVTEATGGSDPSAGRTTYVKDGADFVVSGRKCFITNSHIADVVTILAKDESDPKAFSAFVFEKGMQGFRPVHEEHKMGMRGCNTGELSLDKCRAPAEHLLGPEGKGLRVTMSAIGDVGRGGMVGCALGAPDRLPGSVGQVLKRAHPLWKTHQPAPDHSEQTCRHEDRSRGGAGPGVPGGGHAGLREAVQQRVRGGQIFHHRGGPEGRQNGARYSRRLWLHGRVRRDPLSAGCLRPGAFRWDQRYHEGDYRPVAARLIAVYSRAADVRRLPERKQRLR